MSYDVTLTVRVNESEPERAVAVVEDVLSTEIRIHSAVTIVEVECVDPTPLESEIW